MKEVLCLNLTTRAIEGRVVAVVLTRQGRDVCVSGMENSRLSIAARVPLVDPINVLQANVLLRMRHDENQPDIQHLRDAFAITVQGVAAGPRIRTRNCTLPLVLLCHRQVPLVFYIVAPLICFWWLPLPS